MPLRFLAGLLAVATAVAGSGCRSGEPSVEGRLTACEVLTADEVANAVERAVATPPAASDAATDQLAGRSGCAWSSEDGEVAVLIELVRTADMARSVRRTGFSAAARFQAAHADHPEADELELGDRSLYVAEESKLWLLVDDSLVVLEVAATPTSAARRIAQTLGSRALPRLKRADS